MLGLQLNERCAGEVKRATVRGAGGRGLMELGWGKVYFTWGFSSGSLQHV